MLCQLVGAEARMLCYLLPKTTQNYIVYFEGDIDELQGELVNVKIEECETFYLSGSRVD